ncbi:PH domain-containing protein [Flavobacterium sp.]|uniref:PH domain-containing protein n=1 Tax=Flavobacterium sp. TaxID=239 RepID=UPI00260B568C|nr:PH domain-containing protein [Flavobacterium sp.]
MKRFLSTKNTFTIFILWGLVVFLISILALNLNEGNTPLIPLIVISLVTAFVLWVLLDTRYVIKNNFLLYRSGPIRGRIDITKIKSIKRHSGLNVPVMLKPSLDTKGFIVTYNTFDDLFISPIKSDIFLEEIKKINPQIELI